jgi:hypothetical protein
MAQKSWTDMMQAMGQVNEPGLRSSAPKRTETNLSEQSEKKGDTFLDSMRRYEKMVKKEQEKLNEEKSDVLHDIVLENKDKVRVVGALQVIKELVNTKFGKEDPQKVLEGIVKIINSFQDKT